MSMTDMELRAHLIERHRYSANRFPYSADWDEDRPDPDQVFTTIPRDVLDKMHKAAHANYRFRKGAHYHKELI